MKQIYVLFVLFLFLIEQTQAQSCATPDLTDAQMQTLPYYGNNAWLQHYADSLAVVFNNPINRIESSPDVYYKIPIQFWVYTWDGRNSLRRPENEIDKTLKSMMWYLNDAMQRNQVPIRFYMLCTRFIEDRQATIGNSNLENMTTLGFNHQTLKVMNCHILNSIGDNDETLGMWHTLNNGVFINQRIIDPTIQGYEEVGFFNRNGTFIHEVGHWLGLNHTHHWDGFPCLKEPVSREIFYSICGGTKKHCELRGDALCDTPADPDISQHENDLLVNCTWVKNIKDDRGDFYAPDVQNYMSYANDNCLTRFTTMQRSVMLWGVNKQQSRLGANFATTPSNGFDTYEPDNSAQTSSLLRFNEPQIHSFSDVGSCVDDDDWVKFVYRTNDMALEDMTLEIENVETYNNPVLDVELWSSNIDISSNSIVTLPNATNRIPYIQTNIQPIKITYTIPCSLIAGRTYLLRVVRNGSQTGRYKLTLKKKTPQLFGDRFLCLGIPKTYILDNVPSGSNINWQVSRNIQIVNGQGTNTLTVVSNNFGEGTIGVTISGCNNTYSVPTIPIIMGVSQVFPVIFTATPIVGQVITFTIQKPLPLNVDAYTYQPFVIAQNPNNQYNWSLVSYTDTGTNVEMYIRVGIGVADIGIEVNSCNQIIARPNVYVEGIPDPNCYYGLRVLPNPTKDFIGISRVSLEPCIGLRTTYQGKLYNKFNKIIWQGEVKEDIQIDARKLPNDVYFLHIVDEKGNIQKQQIILNK